jgi:hypothetical protein
VGFVVDKAALGQVFSPVLRLLLPIIPANDLHSSSSKTIQGWHIRPVVGLVILNSVSLYTQKRKREN